MRYGLLLLVISACGDEGRPPPDGVPVSLVDASAESTPDEPEPKPKGDGCTECDTCEAECVGCTLTGCERTICCRFVGDVCSCDTSSWSPAPSCVVGYCL